MKKDVGMTTAQISKETRRMESLFCISSQQSLHIRTLLHYNLKLPDVYVGIVGWIYRTKIPSFLFPYFFEQWSSLHLFFISRNAFSLIYNKMLIAHSCVEYQIYYYPRLGIFHSAYGLVKYSHLGAVGLVINHDIQCRSVQ